MVEAVHERLSGVVVERLPWAEFIARYDRAGTLFYLDPPYHGCEGDYGKGMFGREEFEQMAQVLRGISGRFILSLNDRPEVRRIFAGQGNDRAGGDYQRVMACGVTGDDLVTPLSTVDNVLYPLLNRSVCTMISADLGQQLEQFVASLVATGRYNSKSEVLREGVRLIHERETRLAALDASIARGLADAEAGRTTPADTVFDRLEAKYRAMGATDE
ncbi:hypothetical protein E4T56_gene9309 [Termitomyces sp. T112]|nr:hypothetical protein E4T56_gene9309 [Termitomyces sp. T112]